MIDEEWPIGDRQVDQVEMPISSLLSLSTNISQMRYWF